MLKRLHLTPFSMSNPAELLDSLLEGTFQNKGIVADVVEKDNSYEIKFNVPGFKKEDISIDLEEDVLRVTATHTQESAKEGERFLIKERSSQTLSRSFQLPENIDISNIKANQEHGVLTVMVPKKEKQLPASQKINID